MDRAAGRGRTEPPRGSAPPARPGPRVSQAQTCEMSYGGFGFAPPGLHERQRLAASWRRDKAPQTPGPSRPGVFHLGLSTAFERNKRTKRMWHKSSRIDIGALKCAASVIRRHWMYLHEVHEV